MDQILDKIKFIQKFLSIENGVLDFKEQVIPDKQGRYVIYNGMSEEKIAKFLFEEKKISFQERISQTRK